MTLLLRAITAAALALGASTAYAAEDVIGQIDGFTSDGAGHYALRGWACVTTSNVPLSVHMYVGGPVGQPNASIVGGYEANQPSEQGVADACQATGLSYRFAIPLTDDLQKSHGGQPLYVYGISTVGGPNNVLGGSGKYLVPKVAPVSTSEAVYYVHTDRLGSAVVITDTTAKTVSASDYKPYGAGATKQEKPEAPGFTGHYEDPLTGLTYMQARYYDADLGVFLSVDSAMPVPGNLFNFGRYGYANANPLSFIDPDGRSSARKGDEATYEKPNSVDAENLTASVVNAFFWDGSTSYQAWDFWSTSPGPEGLGGGTAAMAPEKPAEPLKTPNLLKPTCPTDGGSYMIGGDLSLIAAAGFTLGIGVYVNPGTDSRDFDVGGYISGGGGIGANLGVGLTGTYVPGPSSNVSGTSLVGTVAAGPVSLSGSGSKSGLSGAFGAGIGLRVGASLSANKTATFGLRDIIPPKSNNGCE
jgi:RHS repeat-associated protein